VYLPLFTINRWAGAARHFDLDRDRCEAMPFRLFLDGFDDGVGQLKLNDLEVGFADYDLGSLAMGTGQSAWEIAVDYTDMVDETYFLEGCEDAIDANYVDFSATADDFLVDGIGAESGARVGQGSDDLHARHGDSVAGVSEFTEGVILISFRFGYWRYRSHVGSILRPSLFHGDTC